MNYRLTINIFSKEMGADPLPVIVQVPEKLASTLMHLTVRNVRLTIEENPISVGVPLLDFDTKGIKPDANRPELKKLFHDKSA